MAAKKGELLPNFVYEGMNRRGQKVKGEVPGKNMALAKAQLRKQGINVTSIRKKSKNLLEGLAKKRFLPWILLFLPVSWPP